MPSNTVLVLVSGPAVGEAQILIWSYSCISCLQCPQLSELVRFLLWELSMAFYIVHRHRVCLVDHVDLICSLYSLWEGFGSSSLATLPLDFNCGFISTSSCKSYTGFAPVTSLEDLCLPLWGLVWRSYSWLGLRGSGCTKYSGELAATVARNIVL